MPTNSFGVAEAMSTSVFPLEKVLQLSKVRRNILTMTGDGFGFANGVPSRQTEMMGYMELVPYEFSTISPQGSISSSDDGRGFDCTTKGAEFDRFVELGDPLSSEEEAKDEVELQMVP